MTELAHRALLAVVLCGAGGGTAVQGPSNSGFVLKQALVGRLGLGVQNLLKADLEIRRRWLTERLSE